MKKIVSLILAVALCVSLAACRSNSNREDDNMDYISLATDFADILRNGQYADCVTFFNDKMKEAMSAEQLKAAWDTTTAMAGKYNSVERIESEQKDGTEFVRLYLAYSVQGIIMQLPFDKEGKVIGLWFNHYESELSESSDKPLPDGLVEQDVTVGEGELALSGKLTVAAGKQAEYAVVLVHGSGPQDMDETISGNKLFRDIAWGLAAQDIDVLRYDKRSYAHPEWFARPENRALTVREETIDDAVAAAKLLAGMGYEKIYLTGHSLGGMLSPRIYFDSGELFSGVIIMAGSTRTLTDLLIDQNNDAMAALPPEQKKAGEDTLSAEIAKLAALDSLAEEQLVSEMVFGMPGWYTKEMNSYDTAALAAKINKPVLVMQGAEDFQVFADKDFPLWQQALKGNEQARFKLYEGLTHLFTVAPDVQTRTLRDYTPAKEVEPQVITDIVEFIKGGE